MSFTVDDGVRDVTAAEIASVLRVTPTTVRAWISAGKLPAHRIGIGRGEYRVRRADLEAFLARQP